MLYYDYKNFQQDTNKLITQVQEFQPESIVAVARGGLTLAHCMAEGLELRELQSLRTELYDKTTKREKFTICNSCSFDGVSRVLVVDDIADSGETLQNVMQTLQELHPEVIFKSATLFYKKTSCYQPTYWVNEAKEWIEFFWESDFTTQN